MQQIEKKIRQLQQFILHRPANEQLLTQLDLLKALVQRDLEARYKGSIFGNLWPLLNQLAQLLIYTYVFSVVLQVKLSLQELPESNVSYGLWLFAGLLPWMTFTNGLVQATGSVLRQTNLVKKVLFPLVLLPIVPILSTFLESIFGLLLLMSFVLISTQTLHSSLFLLPLVWLPQLLLTAGLGYLTAALTVFLRDIPQTVGIALNLGFYLTPIVYPASAIPKPFSEVVFWINPLAAIAQVYRDLILVGSIGHWWEWTVATVLSSLIFIGGFWVYRRLQSAFADVL